MAVTLPVQVLVASQAKKQQVQTMWPKWFICIQHLTELPLVETGCDSYASWHPAFKHLSPTQTTEELVERMLALTPNNMWQQNNGNDVHLVITGGEPLLGWQRAYAELLSHPRMADLKNITFETNGTQELHKDFRHFLLDWTLNPRLGKKGPSALTFSVSAKLSASRASCGKKPYVQTL
jgi:organic radical activating enzyme